MDERGEERARKREMRESNKEIDERERVSERDDTRRKHKD